MALNQFNQTAAQRVSIRHSSWLLLLRVPVQGRFVDLVTVSIQACVHRPSYEIYTLRAEVLSWAMRIGRLTYDGSITDTYTLDDAVHAALTGQLYALAAASDDKDQSRRHPLIYVPQHMLTAPLLSAAQRVLSVKELVAGIVEALHASLQQQCTHSYPFTNSSFSCCGAGFGSVARVNTTFFYEVSPLLWQSPPCLSNLMASLRSDGAKRWYDICGHMRDM